MAIAKEELLAIAGRAVDGLVPGIEFQLSDLVASEAWTDAPKGARLAAGMAFRAMMERDPRIECLGRDAENHRRYRKAAS